MKGASHPTDLRIVTRCELIERYGITVSHMTLWRWERKGFFPKRIRIGPRTIAWRADEIEAWLAERRAR